MNKPVLVVMAAGMGYSWLIFLSNIMMFTLEGDVKDRLVTVELGGLVGLVLTVAALLSISALTPILGDFFGFILPLVVTELIEENKAKIQVLRSTDKWVGVTYREDKPLVVDAIARKTAEGQYPEKLWE